MHAGFLLRRGRRQKCNDYATLQIAARGLFLTTPGRKDGQMSTSSLNRTFLRMNPNGNRSLMAIVTSGGTNCAGEGSGFISNTANGSIRQMRQSTMKLPKYCLSG